MAFKVFDFKCRECGDISQHLYKLGEEQDLECKVCGSKELDKLPAATRVNFNKGPYDTYL